MTFYYVGYGLGSVLFAIPDRIGRYKTMVVFGYLHLITQFMVIFCQNYYTKSCAFFLMGFFHIKTSLSFVYLFELSPQKNKMLACSFVNLIDALPLVLGCIYFKYISTNVNNLLIVMSSLHLLAVTIITLAFPESPKWLLITG
mmetsp:Transcript_24412/g.17166  ORF Transcript_24412/g.17166 Transcript_24412/m.17166 type:complete len:143 (+) Transcript_24412:91-519(+)